MDHADFKLALTKKSSPFRRTFARANQAVHSLNLLHCSQRLTPWLLVTRGFDRNVEGFYLCERYVTRDDFLHLKFFKQNLYCWKEELFNFPTEKLVARSVKERQSYRSSKSSGFENRLSPSPWERADLTAPAPSGLLFDPNNDSFACIPTGRCRITTQANLLLFSVRIFMRTVRWPCLLCSDTRQRSHVLKENDWHDVTRKFRMGVLRGSGGRAVALVNFKVVVLGLETRWRPILKLPGPKLAKQAHVSSPSTACYFVLKLWSEAFMHTVSHYWPADLG